MPPILVSVRVFEIGLGILFNFTVLGVPDEAMATCRKVMSKTGAVYRGGGFYFLEGNVVHICILTQANSFVIEAFDIIFLQVYKASTESIYAVCEELSRRRPTDPFLVEANISIFRKSGNFLLLENLSNVT